MPTNDSEATSSTQPQQQQEPKTPQLKTVPTHQKRGWQKLISLDGDSRFYTLTVLTTLAFTIATVYFDIGFLETDKDDEILLEQTVAFHSLSAAGRQIVRALALLLLCLFIGAYSFMLLSINVYKFGEQELNRHRLGLTLSFIGAIIANTLVVIIMVTSQLKYYEEKDERDHYGSGFSHYLLFTILLLSTAAMDFCFLEAFTASYQKLLQNESKDRPKQLWLRLQSFVRKRPPSEWVPDEEPNRRLETQPTMTSRLSTSVMAMFTWVLQKTSSGTNAIVCGVRWLLGILIERVASQNYVTEDVSDFFLDITDSIEESFLFQTVKGMASYLTWGIWNPPKKTDIGQRESVMEDGQSGMKERSVQQTAQFFRDTVQYWRRFGEGFRSGVDELYDDVREDDNFHHSSWVLAAMCTALVLLLYFGMGLATYTSNFIDEMYIPRRNCVVWTIENNGELGNFVLRLAGFTEASADSGQAFNAHDEGKFTEAACNIDISSGTPGEASDGGIAETLAEALEPDQQLGQLRDQISDMGINATAASGEGGTSGTSPLDDGRYFSCSSESYSDQSCATLLLINQLEQNINASLGETKTPTDVFRDQGIGQIIYVVDQLMRHLRWSIWIGLMAGIVVGIYSLLSVLAQYKRISLAIRSGFFKNLELPEDLIIRPQNETEENIHRVEGIVTERDWKALIVRYPMGASVFFFGILVSTAVIQLVLFGGFVSLLLSLIASIFEHRVFVILRPFMAFLIAFLITWLLNGPLAQMVISEGILVQKYHIYHELSFLFFLLVYTAVHLVLGVFFALMRLVWVLLTTIACLNRLDRNLFPILQQNDLGHKSFMSTVLMQHAFLENASTGERHLFAVLVARLRESQGEEQTITSPNRSQPDTSTVYAAAQTILDARTPEIQEEPEEGTVAYLHDGFGDNDSNATAANSTFRQLPIV